MVLLEVLSTSLYITHRAGPCNMTFHHRMEPYCVYAESLARLSRAHSPVSGRGTLVTRDWLSSFH